jgi:putative glycosyltransferase (TIGR04372 family)
VALAKRLVRLLLRLLRPFVLVRVDSMVTYRLGHLTLNNALYLCARDAGLLPRRCFDAFFHTPLVCNGQMKAMFDRSGMRIHRWPVYVMKSIQGVAGYERHIVGTSSRDRHGLLETHGPHLSFTPEEEAQGRAFLRELGVEQGRFVCLLCRDSAYLDKHLPGVDWSYHDYRDVDIATYLPALHLLADAGYHVLRMGAAVKAPLDVDHPRIIDYATNGLRTEFLDIYLAARCRFFISNGSGLENVSKIFHTPVLYVNAVPLELVRAECSRDMLVFKKVRRAGDKRMLSVGEILDNGIGRFTQMPQYRQAGVEVVDNTPDEIRQAVAEMMDHVDGAIPDTEEDRTLQRRFWAHFQPSEWNGVFRARVGHAFLRANPCLLDGPEAPAAGARRPVAAPQQRPEGREGP